MKKIIPFENQIFMQYIANYGKICYSRYSGKVVYIKDKESYYFPDNITKETLVKLTTKSVNEEVDYVLDFVKNNGKKCEIVMPKDSVY